MSVSSESSFLEIDLRRVVDNRLIGGLVRLYREQAHKKEGFYHSNLTTLERGVCVASTNAWIDLNGGTNQSTRT